ncbi:MAG: immunoglobulin-like domain-containing protein [Thermoleophilia bacterium]
MSIHRLSTTVATLFFLSIMVVISPGCEENTSSTTSTSTAKTTSTEPIEKVETGVVFRTDKDSYSPGEKANLMLENHLSSGWIMYNMCFINLELERFETGVWKSTNISLGPGGVSACTDIGYSLGPGGGDTGIALFQPDIPVGRYRIVLEPDIDGERQRIATNEFDIK